MLVGQMCIKLLNQNNNCIVSSEKSLQVFCASLGFIDVLSGSCEVFMLFTAEYIVLSYILLFLNNAGHEVKVKRQICFLTSKQGLRTPVFMLGSLSSREKRECCVKMHPH